MAQYFGTIQGNSKTFASRCGTKYSGLTAEANGWQLGGKAEMRYNEELQTDEVRLIITTGSTKINPKEIEICSFIKKDNEFVPIYVDEDILKSFYLKVLKNADEPEQAPNN